MNRTVVILGFVAGIVLSSRPSVAQYTANFQTNIISGVTSNVLGDYSVGFDTFADTLLILDSGVLSNEAGYLGHEISSSNNSAVVSGTGSIWSNHAALIVGNFGQANSLVISNGGVAVADSGCIGCNASSSNNNVVVDGVGSIWKNSYLAVGNDARSNILVISNGGQVASSYGDVGSYFNGSNNNVLVTGSGSFWNSDHLRIGFVGFGNTLVISNGGKVSGLYTWVGDSGRSNKVIVTDSGSVWSNRLNLYIGSGDRGNSVAVLSGGKLFSSTVGWSSYGCFLGNTLWGSNSSLLVSGPGSICGSNANLVVGLVAQSNSLVVSDGGKVLSQFAVIGSNATAKGNSALVTGAGSVWTNSSDLVIGVVASSNSLTVADGGRLNSRDLYVGMSGIGNTLVISNGGSASNANAYIGYAAATNSSVIVDGPGSLWSSWSLFVGNDGVGNRLVISNGGRVYNGDGWLGGGWSNSKGSSNSVLVTGSGSFWRNGGSLTVGWTSGGNSLIVSDGGLLLNTYEASLGFMGSNNSVLVTGSGSVWSNYNQLTVGSFGANNSVVISNGGYVFNGVGAGISGSNNNVVVTGTGSFWTGSPGASLGFGPVWSYFVVSDGGAINRGSFGGTKNTALITGSGSVWSNAGLAGTGCSLVISNFGQVYSSGLAGNSNITRVLDGGVLGTNTFSIGGASNLLGVAGGVVLATNLTVGSNSNTCNNVLQLDSGSVIVTNAATNAVLEVKYGKLIFNGGMLQADRFVMTNACAQFVRTGGTLIYGTAVLDPNRDDDGDGMPNGWEQSHGLDPLNAADVNADTDGDGQSDLAEFQAGTDPTNSASAFRIVEIAPDGDDIMLTWTTVGGKKYAVQFVDGGYTNGFIEFEPVFIAPGSGESTFSVIDPGTATNGASRFYRVRLVP